MQQCRHCVNKVMKGRELCKFHSKFAVDEDTGSYKLTASGCFDRHDTPRREQEMTKKESSQRENSVGLSRSERSEHTMYKYLKPGMSLDQIAITLNSVEDNSLKWR